MSENESDDDGCFYEMVELRPVISKLLETNESEKIIDEPTTPSGENFYQIVEHDIPQETLQPHIDEPVTPSDGLKPNFLYSVLTQDEYVELMMNYVEEVQDILQLPSSTIKLLLHHFKWNKQRLLEQFYEIDNEDFFRQTQIINPFAKFSSEIQPTDLCSICCSDDKEDLFSLECQHQFCNSCWKNYIINQITNEGLAEKIVCPDFQCEILVDEQTIFKFIENNDSVQHLYNKIMLNSSVDNNPRARWCPGKNCGRIINATSLTSAYKYAQLITCSHCQTSFCFHCGQSWHDPIKCILLIEWNKKLADDSQTAVWLKANTKTCPKCQVSIEKNGGCDHMTCRHCKHEFCWLCFGLWSKHTGCNRYNTNENDNDQIQNKYAEAANRYIHHYDRFRNHEHSLDLETKLFEKIRRKLEQNVGRISKIDIQLSEKAFRILLDCRQLLIFTYPFAYFLMENNQSIVFEQNQADLERACEELSGIVERYFTGGIALDQRRRILQEKSRYCKARKDVLLAYVKEGYINNYWTYREEIKST